MNKFKNRRCREIVTSYGFLATFYEKTIALNSHHGQAKAELTDALARLYNLRPD